MKDVKKMVVAAVLSSLGFILMLIEIPAYPSWLKFDLSDSTVVIGAIVLNPVFGVLIAFIKALLHFMIKGSNVGGLGQFIAFLSSLAYMLPFYYIYKFSCKIFKNTTCEFNQTTVNYKNIIYAAIGSTLSLTIVMSALNYIWLTPLYLELLGLKPEMLVGLVKFQWLTDTFPILRDNELLFIITAGYIPFNFVKGAIISVVVGILSLKLDKLLEFNNKFIDDNESELDQLLEN